MMGLYLIELPDDALTPYVRKSEFGMLYGWGEMPKREVVMCRDCTCCYICDEASSPLFESMMCSGFEALRVTSEESFCSRGKRKEVGE